MFEMRNFLVGFNSRLDIVEENVWDIEDIVIKIV